MSENMEYVFHDYPTCEHCEKRPAACYGAYESEENRAFACSECCGHGNEDGWCYQMSQVPDLVSVKNELMQQRDEAHARIAALEELCRMHGIGEYEQAGADNPTPVEDDDGDDTVH